jgi:hypothetical protein
MFQEALRQASLYLPLSLLVFQHPVDKRPNVHLDRIEFTLEYWDWVRKVVDNLKTGLVDLDGCEMALLGRRTAPMANFRGISDT